MLTRVMLACAVCVSLGIYVNQGESAVAPEAKVKESLEHYFQAWNEADPSKRQGHLEAGWAGDATYTDPSADVKGRDALSNHIAGFLGNPQFKGYSIERVTGIDVHHRSFRFGWEMRNAEGKPLTVGIDYGEFDENGMITKIVGFFGPMPDLAK